MKRALLVTFFVFVFINAFSQYSINDSASVLTQKERKYIEKVIDYQLKFYNRVFPEENINPSDVKLNIYTDFTSFIMLQKEVYGDARITLGGFYSRKNKEAVVCKDKKEKQFMNTCYHELSHFFTNTYFQDIPIWLNEGLAVYFSCVKISDKDVQHKKNSRYISRVKTMIDTRDINIRDFMSWNHSKFRKMSFTHESYGYALGYTIVYFLMQKDVDLLTRYIRLLRQNKTSEKAIDELYSGGFSQFETDFLSFIINKA